MDPLPNLPGAQVALQQMFAACHRAFHLINLPQSQPEPLRAALVDAATFARSLLRALDFPLPASASTCEAASPYEAILALTQAWHARTDEGIDDLQFVRRFGRAIAAVERASRTDPP